MDIVESIGKVLIIGLLFGAGLPALFAFGLRAHAAGGEQIDDNGTVTPGNPAAKALAYLLYGIVVVAILLGLLWITRHTILFHTGIKIFPFGYK